MRLPPRPQLANGNQRLVVDLTLANFTTGVTEIQIPQLSLFYFRRDGAAVGPVSSEGTAAESLSVEGPRHRCPQHAASACLRSP